MKKIIISLLFLIGLIFVLLFIGPVISSGEINLGVITGLLIAAICFMYGFFFDKINRLISKIFSKTFGKIFLSLVLVFIIGCGSVGIFTLANVMKYSSNSEKKTDCVIVLGCQVNGVNPGRYLKARINAAYNYLCENPNATAVLSGGQGAGEDISEARCMYNGLTQRGISPDRLILEEKSTSTRENMQYTKELLDSLGVTDNKITIVTNDFHEYRASCFAKRSGFDPYVYKAKTPLVGYLPFAFREVYAVVWQLVLH